MFMVFEKCNDFLQGDSYINAINIILFKQAVSKKGVNQCYDLNL